MGGLTAAAAAGLRKGPPPTGERSSSGLLEWDSKSDALETLGFLNHFQMKNPSESGGVPGWGCVPGGSLEPPPPTDSPPPFSLSPPDGPYPYTLKLCFSTAQHAS